MKSEEKNKLKKLLRKSHSKNYVKKRLLLNSITANRATIKAHKSHIANSNSLKAKEFSIDMIKACADMNAISPFNPEEYTFLLKHLKEVTLALIQRSIRFMEQNRRGVPNASDIDSAAQSMGLVPPLGVGNTEFIPFHTGGRNALPIISNDSFYAKESKDIDVMSLIKRKPASVVCDASLSVHWLAIEGVQPYSPQNPPPDTLKRLSQISGVIPTTDDVSKDTMNKIPLQPMTLRTEVGLSQTIKTTRCHPRAMESLVIERRPHNVSQELMLYFRELTEACVGGNENRRKEALENLYLDTGLQPLMPYLVTFITEGVRFNVSNNNLAILIYLIRMTKSLIDNVNVCLEPYLHLLVPIIITCIVCRQLCAKPNTDNHWALRDFASKQLVTLCNRYNTASNGLYNRITREFYRSLCAWIEGRSGLADSHSMFAGRLSHQTCQNISHKEKDINDFELDQVKSETTNQLLQKPINDSPKLGMAVSSLSTLYGILRALSDFSDNCVRVLVFPHLSALCRRLTNLIKLQRTNPDQPASLITVESTNAKYPPVFIPSDLNPADFRSLNQLKTLSAVKLRENLSKWRTQQGLSVKMEAYENDYGILADCLHYPSAFPNVHDTLNAQSLFIQ